MDKLLIDFSHCINHKTREIIGDKECKRIIIEHLRSLEVGAELRRAFAIQLDLFN